MRWTLYAGLLIALVFVGACGGSSTSASCRKTCEQLNRCAGELGGEPVDVSQCTSGCTANRSCELSHLSPGCGAAISSVYTCSTSLSCQELLAFSNGLSGGSGYPCEDKVIAAGSSCTSEEIQNAVKNCDEASSKPHADGGF